MTTKISSRFFYRQNDKNKKTAFTSGFIGGDKGSRTPDLFNAIEALYQLSYIPNLL